MNFVTSAQTITDLTIRIALADLAPKIRTSTPRPDIMATAEKMLDRVAGIWRPAIVYRWLRVTPGEDGRRKTTLHTDPEGSAISLDLGHSTCFITAAEHALIAAYTAGREIEEEAMKATDSQEFLAAFILDLIGLLVLEKTGDIVKNIAEEAANSRGLKVSPFLSPGSVHGWDLEEQTALCSLLPLESAGITLLDDAVLTPFKSLSCMIGVGSGYTASEVGSTCQICARNGNCPMQLKS